MSMTPPEDSPSDGSPPVGGYRTNTGRRTAYTVGVPVLGVFAGLGRRIGRYVVVVMLVGGIALLTVGIVKAVHQRTFDHSAIVSTGTVSKVDKTSTCSRSGSTNTLRCFPSYNVTVDYTTANGQSQHFTANTKTITTVGQGMALRYEPEHPGTAELYINQSWTTIWVLIGAGAALTLLGLVGTVGTLASWRRGSRYR